MRYGNCLLYALIRWVVEGGRVELDWTSIRVKLPRFWHIGKNGNKTRFAPVKPEHGWKALPDKLCYRGEVKHDQKINKPQRAPTTEMM